MARYRLFCEDAHARRFVLRSLSKSFAAFLFVAVSTIGANAACNTVNPLTVPLPDPASGRRYEIYVSLPDGYAANPSKSYPLLILADGGRAFPKLSCDVRALAKSGAIGEEPVVVGLSYAIGEDLEDSRRRDYTPVADGPTSRVYGGAACDAACSTVGSTGVHMRAVRWQDVHLNAEGTGYVICLPVPGIVTQVQTDMAATLNIDWVLALAADILRGFGQKVEQRDLVAHLDGWIAASAPGQIVYMPYISEAGERGPFVNADARAGFTGLSLNHTYADVVRAVAEGLGHAMRDCYAAMGRLPGELRLTGGAACSARLRGILSASVRAPVRVSSRDEAGAAGAAMMAAVANGIYPDMNACIGQWVTPLLGEAEQPDPELAAAYDHIFPAFTAARRGLVPAWEALAAARHARGVSHDD